MQTILPRNRARCAMPQRSPVIFWRLVIATISVDVVAVSWCETEPSYDFNFVGFDALMLTQVTRRLHMDRFAIGKLM